jgi:hypothetical protein
MPVLSLELSSPIIIDLKLELKREEMFIQDYARILTGELTCSDFDQIMIKYQFKTRKEARCWFSRRMKNE